MRISIASFPWFLFCPQCNYLRNENVYVFTWVRKWKWNILTNPLSLPKPTPTKLQVSFSRPVTKFLSFHIWELLSILTTLVAILLGTYLTYFKCLHSSCHTAFQENLINNSSINFGHLCFEIIHYIVFNYLS